jgi:nicotinate-nucleotide adenylyltransferase
MGISAPEMIGILGGSFDPVHDGHLHIANAALERLGLDQVHCMPCANPVHRDPLLATARQRIDMLELAIADQPRIVLNRVEIERGGPSYTVDSLRRIGLETRAVLVLLMGGDAFNGFAGWRQPDEILSLAHIAVCRRPGSEIDERLYAENRVSSVEQMRERNSGAILILDVDAPPCSSSSVRAALAEGRVPRLCLHPEVRAYIERHRLYRGASV